ncbi:MAG TPA: xanthine dehydrogenase family protein molybdopterin-binding subunit [Chloroflexota bacterium]|nr:xanthine dehydrogenase family protein molybdopterin-binding subunit [Chloroflexota bacterium]
MATSVIGQRAPRTEGAGKVTGAAKYAMDVLIPGMVWGKALRSPHPYARLKRVDASKARAMPGVLAVITARDIRNVLHGRRVYDLPILAEHVVRFIGEKVAAVAAEDPVIAEAALDLIEVEYEVLDPVLDPLHAMDDDAPLLHPDQRSYTGLPNIPDGLRNVQSYGHWEKGDVGAGFADADLIFEETYSSAMTHQAHLEPQGGAVWIDNEGVIHVYGHPKNPLGQRKQLAEALDVPEERVIYEFVRIGGDYGNKGGLMDIPLCYYLSKLCGRPVRMTHTYKEEFMAGSPRHPSIIHMRTGVKRDGSITAHQVRSIFDGGAYGAHKPTPNVDVGGARKAGGVYRIPNCKIESFVVYTNHVPGGFMRAPGDSQTIFAIESHIDEIARALGFDPLEFRLKNMIREGEADATGDVWRDLYWRQCVDAAVAGSNWGKPKPPNVGRGIAITHRHIGEGEAESLIRVDPSGQVTVVTGTPDAGMGAHVMEQQVAAAVLSVPLDQVTILPVGSDVMPYDPGLGAGRTTHLAGGAVHAAAELTRDELRSAIAETRGWPEDEIVLENGAFRLPGSPEPPVTLGQAAVEYASGTGKPVEFRARFDGRKVYTELCMAQVAEVEVDPETGQLTILHVSAACDSGTIINPPAAEGQVEGAFVQGVGLAMSEEMTIEDGRVTNASFGDYKIPTAADIPPFTLTWIEDAPGPLPFGGRALAEHGHIPTSPAIANAIRDAVGIRLKSIPFRPETIYNALNAAEASKGVG